MLATACIHRKETCQLLPGVVDASLKRKRGSSNHMPKTKRIAITAIFGTIIFVLKMGLPTPIDKMFVIVEALFLALGSLLLGRMGATYVATVGGLLMTAWRVAFAPFSLIFAVVYGVLVDGFFHVLRVKAPHGDVRTGRLVASLTLSTAAIGLLSTYIAVLLEFFGKESMLMMPFLYQVIIVVGIANGTAAGYLASFLWKRYLVQYAQV